MHWKPGTTAPSPAPSSPCFSDAPANSDCCELAMAKKFSIPGSLGAGFGLCMKKHASAL